MEAYEETQKPYGVRPAFKIMNRYAKQLELYMDAMDVTDEDVYCDKTRLNQVLMNLLSNAIKFTPAGGTIEVLTAPEKGSEFIVRVPLRAQAEPRKEVKIAELEGLKAQEDPGALPEKATDFKGKHILLAEDNELNREIAVEILNAFRIRNWQRRIFCWFEREKPVCDSFVSALKSCSRGFSPRAVRALLPLRL